MPALLRLASVETRLFFREPTAVFLALGFAPLLLVILGVIPALDEPDPELGGVRPITLYLPIVVAMGVALFALGGLAQLFAAYREKGVLRRMRTTPVQPVVMLGAQLLMAMILSVLATIAMLAIGRLAFEIELPRNALGYCVAYLLLASAVLAIGLLIAAIAPSSRSASAVGTLAFFPLAFFAGIWLPRDSMNDGLRSISDFTPLGAGVQALQDAAAGEWPQVLHVAVMLGWTIAAGGIAARYFRWE